MKRGVAFVLAALLAGCPGGLPLEYGNAFPCDFNQEEPERDAPCQSLHPGEWVCGTDNLCRPFENEGLQEETPPLTVMPDGGVLLHPSALRSTVLAVGADPGAPGRVLVRTTDSAFYVRERGQLLPVPALAPQGAVDQLGLMTNVAGDEALAVLAMNGFVGAAELKVDGGLAVTGPALVQSGGVELGGVAAVRTDDRRTALVPGAAPLTLTLRDGGVGEAYRAVGVPQPRHVFVAYDGGAYWPGAGELLDARSVPRGLLERTVAEGVDTPPRVPVVFTTGRVLYRERRPLDGGAETWLPLDTGADPIAEGSVGAVVRHAHGGQVWAVKYRKAAAGVDILGTWRLERGNPPVLTRAWTDCAPCGAGAVLDFVPATGGGVGVEVLCGPSPFARSGLYRIRGATTDVTGDACEVEPLDAPFDLNELASAVDQTTGGVVALGGRHGQVWTGSSLSRALPLSLDRVPMDVALFQGMPAALTDEYLALPVEGGNGTVAVRVTDLLGAPANTPGPAAFVRNAPGWLLLENAQLTRLDPNPVPGEPPVTVRFGPALEGPSGAAPVSPFVAEALGAADGGLRILVAAEDSLYHHVVSTVSATPGDIPPELPQLTLEPGFRIRSMTLDRATPARAGSGTTVRGYAVTSRNVFEFTLGGAPERWTTREVPLPLGEPVEVWMSAPRSDLGRVAYRDGTVFTLPGGYPMAEKLPQVADGGVPRVIDFANLNGWPVALTEAGLFVTERSEERFADGGTSRILHWTPAPLPAELTAQPRRFQRGRLEVLAEQLPGGGEDQVLFLFSDYGFVYRLASSRSR